MALEDLVRAFEREAAAEAAVIRARGTAEAAQLAAAATQERDGQIAAASTAFAAERRAAADRELAEGARALRAEVLAARTAMLDRLRAAVAARLPARVAEVGEALLASALTCVGDGDGVLRCAPALAEVARRASRLRVEPDPRVTGVVIELASQTTIDATLDALLARTWPALACEALALARGSR